MRSVPKYIEIRLYSRKGKCGDLGIINEDNNSPHLVLRLPSKASIDALTDRNR